MNGTPKHWEHWQYLRPWKPLGELIGIDSS